MRRPGSFKHLILALAFLIVSLLNIAWLSQHWLTSRLSQTLPSLLAEALEEQLFSDKDGSTTNKEAIRIIGQQLNRQLQTYLTSGPLALYHDCSLTLLQIDGVVMPETGELKDFSAPLHVTLLRNHLPRRAEFVLSCHYHRPLWLLWLAVPALVMGALYRLGVRPLGPHQQEWFSRLKMDHYPWRVARRIVLSFPDKALEFNNTQKACFNALYQPAQLNAADALRDASRADVAALNPRDQQWLLMMLQRNTTDFDRALAVASGADIMCIDLPEAKVSIRGIDIALAKTPLLYLAWYAKARQQGDGWITNPASNKPNRELGAELAAFMWRYKGHAKAIGDLEDVGLKAKTLDQNRSKIKDEISAVLGEELADHYVFETDKNGAAGRSRYRIRLDADAISIVE